jgi:RNA polymerase sigma factor (sigma-70 family)
VSVAALSPVVEFIRKVSAPPPPGDAELLTRFSRHGEEAAFAALVERHGPMVLAVCRRLLRDGHDAEDAFQATFLLLVRKAGSLARPAALGPWLYGVAYRTALKARALAARRRTQAVHEADRVAGDPSDAVAWRDLRPVLDEAIDGLPAKYRAPFVLCYLEGRSNAEAAAELGCPRGTVATRLSRARDRLRQLLSRRGVALSAGVLALLPCRRAVAASLVRATVAAAAGGAPATSTEICALTKGVVHAMFLNRMRLAVAALMVAVVGAGSCFLAGRGQAGPPQPSVAATRPAPSKDEPADPGTYRTKNFKVKAPTARVARLVAEAAERQRKLLAQAWLGRELPAWEEPFPVEVKITTEAPGHSTSFAFAPDRTILRRDMRLEGSLDFLLANALPHEVTHAVLADEFQWPLPRWADEGAATQAEDAQEQERMERQLREVFKKKRAIPLRQLFELLDYPRDLRAFYAQSHSVTRFLVEARGRQTFVNFVRLALGDGWDRAAREYYKYESVEELEEKWLAKVRETPTALDAASPPPPVAAGPRDSVSPPFWLVRARWEKGLQLLVPTPVTSYRLVEAKQKVPGEEKERTIQYYQPVTSYRQSQVTVDGVEAFGPDGQKVPPQKLKRLLEKERLVVVCSARPPAALCREVFKDGTLILVVSALPVAPPPSAPAPAVVEPVPVPPPAAPVPR